MANKILPITKAAPAVPCTQYAMRKLDAMGVVHPVRDPWNRRLFGDDDIVAAREYLKPAHSDAEVAA